MAGVAVESGQGKMVRYSPDKIGVGWWDGRQLAGLVQMLWDSEVGGD